MGYNHDDGSSHSRDCGPSAGSALIHAFKHAVAGSQFCAVCGYQKGHLTHIGSEAVQQDYVAQSGTALAVVAVEEALVDTVIGEDSPSFIDAAFTGGDGWFGGGGASDGW